MAYGGYPGNSCCVFSYGEVEDYCIALVGSLQGDGTTRMSSTPDVTKLTCAEDCNLKSNSIPLPKLNGIGYGSLDFESNELQVSLYPNPVSETFVLEGNTDITEVEIFDIYGKLIQKLTKIDSKSTSVDVSNLPNGQYIARTKSIDGMSATNKFNVQH